MAKYERKFEVFEAELDGVLTKFKVYEPTDAEQREAAKVRNRVFYDAIESGAFLKMQIKDLMRKRNLWSDDKQAEYLSLEKQIIDGKKRLDEGGFKLAEAKELALNMNKWRNRLISLTVDESQLTNETAEGQADNASFNYLVSTGVVYYDTEERLFDSMEDYLNRSTTEIALKAAKCLAALLYGVGVDIEKELPENKFLLEYGFVDDQLRLINKDGQLIDVDGNLVTKDGELIEQAADIVFRPFLDDDGNEIIKEVVSTESEIVDEK